MEFMFTLNASQVNVMALSKELQERFIQICKRHSVNHDEAIKFIKQITISMDGYYLFESEDGIELIFFTKIYFYYFKFDSNHMTSETRHISDISKIITDIEKNNIDINIFFNHNEALNFSIPNKQYKTWMGFYRTLKIFWASSK